MLVSEAVFSMKPHRKRSGDYKFWRGWEAALNAVSEVANAIPDSSLTPEQTRLKDYVLFLIRRLTPDDELLVRKVTDAQLAKKFGCAPRTIRGWRAQDAPLDGSKWQMGRWLFQRHCVPRGSKQKFAKIFARFKPG